MQLGSPNSLPRSIELPLVHVLAQRRLQMRNSPHSPVAPRRRYQLLVVLTASFVAGCGGRPETADVSGKVLYKDGSVPKGGVRVVQFVPLDSTDAEIRKAASGQIQDDGSFTLSTRKPGDGVFLGEYAVTFTVWKGPRDPVSLIKEEFTNAGTTPYKVTVDGDRDDLTFEIEPK